MSNTVLSPSAVCMYHGIHCWHQVSVKHEDFKSLIQRTCCWCGENWGEVVHHASRSGWSHNPDAHPEHGRHKPKIMGTVKGTGGRLYG